MGKIKDAVKAALDQRVLDAEVARRLEIIDGYGPDREDGTVLRFEKALPIGPTFEPGQVVRAQDMNRLMEQSLLAQLVAGPAHWPGQVSEVMVTRTPTYAATPAPAAAPTSEVRTDEDGRPLKTYMYVALRAGGRWHLSGAKQAGKSYTWAELGLWLAGDGEPVTTLVELIEAPEPVPARSPRAVPEVGRPGPRTQAKRRGAGSVAGTGTRGNSSGNTARELRVSPLFTAAELASLTGRVHQILG